MASRPPPLNRRRRHGDDLPHSQVALRAFEALLRLGSRLQRIRCNALEEFGLTHAQARVVGVAYQSPGLCISEIARRLDLTRQAVHRVARHLERCRYLEFEPGCGPGAPLQVHVAPEARIIVEGARAWEMAWLGEEVGHSQHRDALDALWAAGRQLRRRLPWRGGSVEDLARWPPISQPRSAAADATGYAVHAAASR